MNKAPYIPLYIDKWKAMTDTIAERDRNKVVAAYLDYIVYGKEPRGLTKIGRMLFEFLRSTADDWKKDKGGAPIGNKNAKKKTTDNQPVVSENNQPVVLKTEQPPLYTKTEAKTNTKTKTEGEPPISPQGGVAAPSLEQAEEFARAEGLRTNVKKFYWYWSARSWMTNGEPVRDWKALLCSWASRDREEEKPEPERPKEAPVADKCPECGSSDIRQQGGGLICDTCGKGFAWTGKRWRED